MGTFIIFTKSFTLQSNPIKKLSKSNPFPKEYKIGIVGATGAVGNEIIECLYNTEFPVSDLCLYTSKKSSNQVINTNFGRYLTSEFNLEDAKQCDIIFLAVSGDFSKQYAKDLSESCYVIDNSSAFRYDDDVPLIIPEK